MTLKQKVESGVSWNIVGQTGNQFISIILTLVLARLLTPSDFGTVAMITVFTGFSSLLIDFGFGSAIIQNRNLDHSDLSSIFWLNLMIGGILTLALILISPLIVDFYNKPDLRELTVAISFTYFFSSINVVQSAIFTRDFKFKELVIRRLVSTFLGGMIGVILAYLDYGPWAIAMKIVSTAILSTIFIWIVSDWKPLLIFKKSSIASVLKLSSSMFFNSSLGYAANNLDNMLIGKSIGDKELGLYSKAYQIIGLPVANISKVLTKVMLPSFSEIQKDKGRISRIYLQMNSFVLMITAPLMLILFMNPKSFVIILFGRQWLGMVPIIPFFAVSGILASLNALIGSVVISQNRSDLIYREGLLKKVTLIIAISIGVNFGLMGVVLGKLISDIFSLGVTFYHGKKALDISIWKQILNLKEIVFYNLITLIITEAFVKNIIPQAPFGILLILEYIFTYILLYYLILKITKNENLEYLISYLRKKVNR